MSNSNFVLSRNSSSDQIHTSLVIHNNMRQQPQRKTESVERKVSLPVNFDNLGNVLSSITPTVRILYPSESMTKGNKTNESGYFSLEDLWESFSGWSAYGVPVPLMLNGVEAVKQYFVPYLSAIQLFLEPQGSDAEAENCNSLGELAYNFFEKDLPHTRPPLHQKVSILASEFPHIITYKSSELSHYSWFSVAWYPIYRIPVGSSLKDFETSFLTFHSLSTNSMGHNNQSGFHASNDGPSKMHLPIFGLATYKLRGSMAFTGTSELQRIETLSNAAADWLQNLQTRHPDYDFFASRP